MTAREKHIAYTAADFQRYHSGSMSEAEMHALEKAALEDPFLSDALDGYSLTGTGENDIAELQKIISEKKTGKKIFFLFVNKDTGWWKVAAVLILIAGTVYLALNLNDNKKQPAIAKNKTIPKEQTVIKTDSAKTIEIKNGIQNSAVDTHELKLAQLGDQAKKHLPNSLRKDIAADTNFQKDIAVHIQQPAVDSKAEDNASAAKQAPPMQNKSISETEKQTGTTTGSGKYRLTGTVVDEQGMPLAFVNIQDKKRNIGFSTDFSGKFSILSNDSIVPATIAAIGYDPVQKELSKNIDQTIKLSSSAELSEVIVTAGGLARQKKEISSFDTSLTGKIPGLSVNSGSSPVPGKIKFDRYLNDHIKKPLLLNKESVNYAVMLSFKIKKNGSPKDIRIERSICKPCGEEAARLLLAGPKWKYVDDKRTTVTITF